MTTKHNHRTFYPILSILIPCTLGIVGMVNRNVSISIWIQNLLIMLLLTPVCFFVSKKDLKLNYKAIVLLSAILLGMTFSGPNLEGVHRWIKVPFFTLNIATMVLPITLVALHRLIEEKQFAISVSGIMIIAFLLYFQPDASQLLAFSIPAIILMLRSGISRIIKGGFCGVLLVLTLKSWLCLDSLQPVDYTEGILTMLQDVSVVLYVAGIVALFLIPVCFLVFCKEKSRNICTGIAIYYWLMILSTFAGNFPVPFMGYGISPVLGFFAFLIWFVGDDKGFAQREGA